MKKRITYKQFDYLIELLEFVNRNMIYRKFILTGIMLF